MFACTPICVWAESSPVLSLIQTFNSSTLIHRETTNGQKQHRSFPGKTSVRFFPQTCAPSQLLSVIERDQRTSSRTYRRSKTRRIRASRNLLKLDYAYRSDAGQENRSVEREVARERNSWFRRNRKKMSNTFVHGRRLFSIGKRLILTSNRYCRYIYRIDESLYGRGQFKRNSK